MVRGADFDGDTATLLRDGKVLVTGVHGAQLYDPDSGTWTATGKMTPPLLWHAATLLADGEVLAVGGDPDDQANLNDPVYWRRNSTTRPLEHGRAPPTCSPGSRAARAATLRSCCAMARCSWRA